MSLKKMQSLIPIVESSSESVLYAMDETRLRTESDIRRTWSEVGISPVLERNGSYKGVNIIGATEITKEFTTIADIYPSKHKISSEEIIKFLEHLLEVNPNKKVYVIMDNAATHTSKMVQQYWDAHKDELVLINQPTYSPELNPQEQLWNRLKQCIFSTRARSSEEELTLDVLNLYSQFNEDTKAMELMISARNYYF